MSSILDEGYRNMTADERKGITRLRPRKTPAEELKVLLKALAPSGADPAKVE